MNYYELILATTWSHAEIERRLQVEGGHHVDAARASGRGAIVVFVHAGPFEAFSALAILRPDWRLLTLVEHMRDPRIHELMRHMRERSGVAVISVDRVRDAVRQMLRGAVLLIGSDRDVTHSGLTISFFGAPARLPDGAVRLARRFDVPLLLVYATRGEGSQPTYHARVRQVAITRTADAPSDVIAGVQAIARAVESVVTQHPGQWVANYDFWGGP